MLAELIGICKIVLQLPELAVVLLPAHGIGITCPTTEVDYRLVGRGVGSADIETKFAPEHEMLHRSQLSVKISSKFLTAKKVLVHHSESHRVGACVTLTHGCRIVSVNVIDRNVRQSRE